jgi:hypothetical protein
MRTTATMMFGVGEKSNTGQPLAVSLRFAGGDRRIHGVHPVELSACRTPRFGRTPLGRGHGGRIPESAGNLAALSFEFSERAVELGDAGIESLPDGLRFGGNDVGSVMLEENVVRAAGVTNCTTEEELRRIIRDAGFRPAQRDTLYRQYFLN